MGQEQQDSGVGEIAIDELKLVAPASRPVLLTNKEELEDIRGRLSEPGYAEVYQAVLKLAESDPADVTSPLAAAADVDPRLFDVGWRLMGMESVLPAAGVAWQLTGDRAHVDRAVKLLQTAVAWHQWSDGRHAVVDGYYNAAPETASGMRAFAWALDFFAGALPNEVEWACRRKLASFAQRLSEISSSSQTRWAANPFDDWSATIHSAIGHAALALCGADSRAENWLRLAISRILAYLDCLPGDGGHPSGIARWEFALTHCCTFLEALYRFSGTDLRRHPALERTRRFAVRCLAPGGQDIVQIDQGLPLQVSSVTTGPLSKLLAKWFQDPVISWAVFNTPRTPYVQAADLLWYDESIPRVWPGEAGEGSKAFSDIGWLIMRSGWGPKDNMLAFKSTPFWPGYHHLDQGTFQIFARGREIVLDSGLGWRAHPNYFDRYRDSLAHNVVLIDGKGQLRHDPESHAEMHKIELSERADYAVGECAGAYEGVDRFTRAVLFLKPNVIVIRDIIELDRPQALEWLLHGGGNFEVHVHDRDKGFTLQAGDTAMNGFILKPVRWKHTLRRGYKLTDWQTRHEVTHPVLVILPDKSAAYDISMVFVIDDADKPREFPGRPADDGTATIKAGGIKWSVRPSGDGLEFQPATSRQKQTK
ncbi:MAG: heparinase II/III family protein [Armatimonadetes bacterium]|nr:heparinase II/III family protein [Armatimonadota bacterium]